MPFASNSGFIYMCRFTGLGERQLPRAMRDIGDEVCDVRTFIALCGGDETMDTRSYEVMAGSAGKFAEFYGRRRRQMCRILERGDSGFIHRLPGGLLATVVSSGANHRDYVLAQAKSDARRDAALARWTRNMTDVTPAGPAVGLAALTQESETT